MESKLSTLSTREESNKRFDTIEALLLEQSYRRGRIQMLTGKRKDHTMEGDEEMAGEEDDDVFVDSSPTMDTDDNMSKSNTRNNNSGGDNTNSLVVYDGHKTPVK
jgi:hypothetical protein